jgi:hypothetical protein
MSFGMQNPRYILFIDVILNVELVSPSTDLLSLTLAGVSVVDFSLLLRKLKCSLNDTFDELELASVSLFAGNSLLFTCSAVQNESNMTVPARYTSS